jgi:hypothetical protein
MKTLLVALLLCCATEASAQLIEGVQTSTAVPIFAGNPVIKNLIGSVTLDARIGEVYAVSFEAELAPYGARCVTLYGHVVHACLLWEPMAVTTGIFAFQGSAPQTVAAGPGRLAPANATVVGPAQGRDIAVSEHDYYSPVSRTVLYQATATGPVTIGVYSWGFSSAYPSGSVSAVVYPGTFSLRAVRLTQ